MERRIDVDVDSGIESDIGGDNHGLRNSTSTV